MGLRLADRLGGRDNNLNLIRIIAAIGVLMSHSFPITLGPTAHDPLASVVGSSVGWFAVAIFFCISGLLISRSFDRRRALPEWFLARFLRLFPGLLAVLSLTVLVLGPLLTALPVSAYWADPATWSYLPKNLVLAWRQHALPGVFSSNPYGPAINGSLWSLYYEVVCYGGVLLAGLLGMFRYSRLFGAAIVGFAIAYGLLHGLSSERWHIAGLNIEQLFRLAYPFALGMAAYVWRDRLTLDWRIMGGLWLLALLSAAMPFFTEMLVLAICYSVLVLAFVPQGRVLGYNRLGDYSYGTYIYAFPVQQLMVHLMPGQHWAANIALSLPVTLLFAVMSWHWVERPALAMVRPLADRLGGRTALAV